MSHTPGPWKVQPPVVSVIVCIKCQRVQWLTN
jgi:hypothetical protein